MKQKFLAFRAARFRSIRARPCVPRAVAVGFTVLAASVDVTGTFGELSARSVETVPGVGANISSE